MLGSKAAPNGGGFDRQEEVTERLRHQPGQQAQPEGALTDQTPIPTRWTVRTIRASFAWLRDSSLRGGWRLVRRYDLRVRSARIQHYSPDPD